MARAIDVAKYILERRDARGHATTTFALQKLLYYSQSWMLVARNRELFHDKIVAWRHGPVVENVVPYCSGRHYIFPREMVDGESSSLSISERSLVDAVIDLYENEDDSKLGDSLEQMSHQEKPWADVGLNEVIAPESMLEFYSSVQADSSTYHAAPIPDLANISDRTFISDTDADWLNKLFSH